jgi:hypothetical protein
MLGARGSMCVSDSIGIAAPVGVKLVSPRIAADPFRGHGTICCSCQMCGRDGRGGVVLMVGGRGKRGLDLQQWV